MIFNIINPVIELESVYIFDLDGTLCNNEERVKYLCTEPKDWDNFYDGVDKDKTVQPIKDILMCLSEKHKILFVTGRPERVRKSTETWLQQHVPWCSYELYMRPDGDHSADFVVKKRLYKMHIKDYYFVVAVFEDRKQCVDMWRKEGLVCLQVAEGDY